MSAAADEDTFNGALGWADWIWWSIIGGVALLLILLLLCCCVCVKRAKRKGRQEAMAAVQARERELQERQQAQMRYAQAQQARFPAQNQNQQQTTFNYSKENKPYVPPPPKVQGPQVSANGYALPQQYAPQHQQQQQYAQPSQQYAKPHPQQQQQQYGQQPQQYAQPPPPPQQNAPVVNYSQAIPSRYKQTAPPPQQQQQYVQQQQPMPPAPVPVQPQPQPPRNQEPASGLMHPKRWYDKAPVNPTTTAAAAGINYDDDDSLHHDAPFMPVTSPKKKAQASGALPVTTTLRDRIDALREGSVQENHTRISVATDASYQPTPTITRDEGANNSLLGGRRSMVMAGSVLSPSHSLTNGDGEFESARSDDTFSVHPRTHRGPSFDNSEHEDDVHAASFNSRGSVEF